MNKNDLCIIFEVMSQIQKNQQKIATEQIKTATRSKLIIFKTRETQTQVLKMKNRKSKCLNQWT
jgi:hypothetical protein